MELLLLITSSSEITNILQSCLSDEYVLLTADTLKKGAELLHTEQITSIAIDITTPEKIETWLEGFKTSYDTLKIGIVPFDISEEDMERYNAIFDDIIYTPLSRPRLKATLKKIRERHNIMDELRNLKLSSAESKVPAAGPEDNLKTPFSHIEKAITFSKIFTSNNFDLDRTLNMFLDTLTEIAGVGRASLLLTGKEGGNYRIKCSKGLSAEFTSRLSLPSDSAIILWLAASGRILKRTISDPGSVEQPHILFSALREMKMLHSAVTIPVVNEGRLLGILNLDNKITGVPFSNSELEWLFILTTYLGKSICDIYLFQNIRSQMEYFQKTLEQMEIAKKEFLKEVKTEEDSQIFNELVGRMSHELRNPLVSIRTFTQLMKERYNDPEFQDFFYNTVTGEVEKLNSLVEKLIAFTHPIEYKFSMADIAKILDSSILAVTKGIKQAEFRIVRNYKSDTVILRTDKVQLEKAFSHIIQNSFNAMNSGGTLTIDVDHVHGDETCSISITDTGKGIPKEDIDRIFDPFYTTPEKGVGLGLPLSKKIIEGHGGKITVHSVLNQGTTLTVLLPVTLE